jgi:hypothetical protein
MNPYKIHSAFRGRSSLAAACAPPLRVRSSNATRAPVLAIEIEATEEQLRQEQRRYDD